MIVTIVEAVESTMQRYAAQGVNKDVAVVRKARAGWIGTSTS